MYMSCQVSLSRTGTDSLASYRTPLYSDFLLAHSTVSGYYSWRNTVQGSWFIQVPADTDTFFIHIFIIILM